MKTKNTYLFLVAISLCLFFTTCKKYPENTLWLKSASKTIRGDWNLTFFEINGNDSLNSNVKQIGDKKINFTLTDGDKFLVQHTNGKIEVSGDSHFVGFWTISKNKKEIKIIFNYTLENYTNQYNCVCYNFQNIFASYNEEITWQIEKLSRQDFWITTNFNNLKYELHFKK